MRRIATIEHLFENTFMSLSVGAKETRLATVNIDVQSSRGLDAVCTVTHLPFKSNCFLSVLFADVLEHLPPKAEESALKELARILHPSGRLLVTTPNERLPYKFLDPAWFLLGHRHYARDDLRIAMNNAGFAIIRDGTFGLPVEMFYLLVLYSSYPIKMITGKYPGFLTRDEHTPDTLRGDDLGYTRYALACKREYSQERCSPEDSLTEPMRT